eukprot:m.916659 g.916659  ORF g.916659 m.916659 type:complete len:150 (+) comp23737_c0_seq10:102-551(+)
MWSTGTLIIYHLALRPPQSHVWTHALLMTIAWGFMVPAGILIARFRVGAQGLWFKMHRAVQCLGITLAVAGFAVIVAAVSNESLAHFAVSHAKIGLAIMVFGVLQPLNAFIRPHPAEGHKPFWRMLWETVHKGLGYVAVLLALYGTPLR